MYEDLEEEPLQADAEPVEKEMINEAYTLLSVATTGQTQRFIQDTDPPLHDESVVAVRVEFLHVTDDRGRLARLLVRDTSSAFDARDQGLHQRGIAHEVLSARTDFCCLCDAPHDNAEECHADQRCAPREECRGCLRILSDNTDLKACSREEKSVVIMNTPDQNVNVIAELVFDMMLHSEYEVTGRSIDSILNIISDVSQAETAPWRSREDQPRSQRGVETTASRCWMSRSSRCKMRRWERSSESVCVRGSAERVLPQWNHRTDV